MIYVFTFTMFVCILNAIQISGIILGNSISLPFYKIIKFTTWYFFYPSLLFQIWFWANSLQIVQVQ